MREKNRYFESKSWWSQGHVGGGDSSCTSSTPRSLPRPFRSFPIILTLSYMYNGGGLSPSSPSPTCCNVHSQFSPTSRLHSSSSLYSCVCLQCIVLNPSWQRVVFHKMSPHETLFRLEATQSPERFVVDHTPLCRFSIWDFPGDYYGGASEMQQQQHQHGQGQEGYYGTSPDGMTPMMADSTGDPYAADQGAADSGMSPLQRQPHVVGGGGTAVGVDQQQQQSMSGAVDGATNGGGDAAGGAEDGDAYVFGRATALIFVIDAQDEPYDHVLQNFTETVTRAIRANPHIAIEVFINKVDGELFLSDEAKYDCRRDVMQQVSDELADAGVPPDSVPISYHLTSIYDHSVFEAFSRVVQKLIPQLPTLENLLNVLVSTCSMEKAYLFDVASKLYISTDSSPVDMQSVELCSDMIDVVLDVSGIYGLRGEDEIPESGIDGASGITGEGASLATPTGTATLTAATGDMDSLATDPIPASDGGPQTEDGEANNVQVEQQSYTTGDNSEAIDPSKEMTVEAGIGEANDELVGTLISQSIGVDDDTNGRKDKDKSDDPDSAYDTESSSVIRLSNGMVSAVYGYEVAILYFSMHVPFFGCNLPPLQFYN